MTLTAHPYRYPAQYRCRRHGPSGYSNYRDYRPWLEDEFTFRCAYCLKRQKWATTDIWSVDHLVPQTNAPELECDYENLVLTCQYCNSRKLAESVPDPVATPYGNFIEVDENSGEISALNEEGEVLIRILKLDNFDHTRARRDRLTSLKFIAKCSPDDWKKLMGFPEELPNLSTKKPPTGNTRPAGLNDSHFELRRRNVLSEVYEE